MTSAPRLLLLGELCVLREGRPVELPASRKTRALLGFLGVTGRAHSRQELCDLLWQGPDDPRAALRWSLSKLREALGPGAIEADRERIALSGVASDLSELGALLAHGSGAAGPVELERARALFRGELLEGLTLGECYRFHEWCSAERERVRGLRVAVLASQLDRTSDAEQALGRAREWVAVDPLSEAAHIAVIRHLGRLGRRRDALAQYEACRRILEQEAGVKPSAALLEAKMQLGAGTLAPSVQPPACPAPAVPSASAPAPPPLVGRGPELERLRQAIERAARAEGPPLCVLLGESGIGKTRLLDELAAETRARGGSVLSGRAYEAETIRPYGPWIDALSELDAARARGGLRSELEAPFPTSGAAAAMAERRQGLFDGVVRLILELGASAGPVCVILDDAQWFDEASVALLHYAARALEHGRALIACAARPAELADNVVALRALRALERQGRSTNVKVGPLAERDLVRLAESVAPGVDAERVAAGSAGNPLFAQELGRALQRGDDSPWDSISELIAERLARLDERSRELVGWAAALGTRFDPFTLERVTGLPPLEVGTALAELERHGIVRASHDGAAYDFAHDLLRAGSYRQLSEPRRRGVHRNIARALSALEARDAARAADVAHHAALGADPELAARAALTAARRCIGLFAGAEAARLVELGRQQLPQLSHKQRIQLELSLLSVLVYSATRLRDLERLKDELTRAITHAEDAGLHDEVAEGLQALSVLQFDHGDLGGAHETTLRVPDAVRSADAVTRARHLGDTARCLAMLERDMAQAHRMYDEARALADQAGARLIAVEWAAAVLLDFSGKFVEAKSAFERVLALARAEQDRWVEYECLRALVQFGLEDRAGRGVEPRVHELVAVAEKMGEGSEGPAARALQALLDYRESVEARPTLEAAIERLRQMDAKGMLAYALSVAAEFELDARRFADAERYASEALRAASAVSRRSQMARARTVLGHAALGSGDRLRAERELAAARVDLDEPLALNARARAAVEHLERVLFGR